MAWAQAAMAQSVALVQASGQLEGPELCLVADPTGGGPEAFDVTVTVEMGFSELPICAAQFFLEYDADALQFKGIVPGGGVFNSVVFEAVDEEAGTIDYLVGENPGAICNGTQGPATVATLFFVALPSCENTGVCFRPNNPPTRLGAEDGSEVCPQGHVRPNGTCGLASNPIADPCCTGDLDVECVENPPLCIDVETQPGKNCLDGVGVGDEVIVTVEMAFSTPAICAAQFFLSYDTAALDFNFIAPGGGIFNTVLLEAVDEVAGTIDYVVGDDPGVVSFGTHGPATVATISFTALAECKNGGVCFFGHNPPTRLAGCDGEEVCPLGHVRPDGSCGLEDNPLADPCCTGPISVDLTPPVMNCPDFKTFGNADCGVTTRTVYWDPLWAVDNCDGAIPVNCTISHNGGADVQHLLTKNGGPFPPGITTIDCGGTTDSCNNVTECVFAVGNSGLNGLHVAVELSPTMDAGPLTRGIDFSVSDCGSIANPEPFEVCVDVNFGFPFSIPGHGVAQAKIPPGNWMCLEAWDPLHTLNATCGVTCEVLPQKGSVWFASFKGSKDLSDTCHWLVNGNLNGDVHVDALDYVTYLACVVGDPTPDPDTVCGQAGPHCDINGDGLVNLLDFSFLMVNLFNDAKAGCDAVCSPSATPQAGDAVESISVRELTEKGYGRVARIADVDNNGVVNRTDMALYLHQGGAGTTRDPVGEHSFKRPRSARTHR